MSTYYVRKTGNDSSGDGSTGAPWLTIDKAFLTVSAGGGHTVKVGAGTYSENSSTLHYLFLNRAFGDWVIFEPEVPGSTVVITDDGTSANYCVRMRTVSYVRFNNIRFTPGVNKVLGTICTEAGYNYNNIYFSGCTIDLVTGASLTYGILGQIDTTFSLQNFTIDGCSFPITGTDTHTTVYFSRLNAAATLSNLTVKNSTIAAGGANTAMHLRGVTDFLISNCYFSSPSATVLRIGEDANTALRTLSGTVQNCTVQGGTSHCILLGAGCDGVTVTGCTLVGGDIALGVKECTNITLTSNIIAGAANYSLYFKAATAATATGNRITNSSNIRCVKMGIGDSGHKCGTITLTGNTIIAKGAAGIFTWEGDASDTGGCVVDYNAYGIQGVDKFGEVRADLAVLTFAELRAAWAGYGDGSNDLHSRLYNASNIFLLDHHRRSKC